VSHTLLLRVYYEDTDAGGVVYHPNYLRFAERGRTEWLRSLGLDHRSLRESHGRQIVVRRCRVEFRRPAKLDDSLIISTQLLDIKGVRIVLAQRVERAGTALVELEVELVVVDLRGRPCRLPQPLLLAVEAARELPRDA
jgi:acyl-CoA thioester hydrolase